MAAVALDALASPCVELDRYAFRLTVVAPPRVHGMTGAR